MKKTKYRILRIKGCGRVAVYNTSKIDDKTLDRMLRVALHDFKCGDSAVHVKQGGRKYGYRGRAYYSVPVWRDGMPYWCRHLIVVYNRDGIEQMVNTAAHEAKHIEDYRLGLKRRASKERQQEARARAAGEGRLKEWNRSERERRIKEQEILLGSTA